MSSSQPIHQPTHPVQRETIRAISTTMSSCRVVFNFPEASSRHRDCSRRRHDKRDTLQTSVQFRVQRHSSTSLCVASSGERIKDCCKRRSSDKKNQGYQVKKGKLQLLLWKEHKSFVWGWANHHAISTKLTMLNEISLTLSLGITK